MDSQPTVNKIPIDWRLTMKVVLTALAPFVLFLGTYIGAAPIGWLLQGSGLITHTPVIVTERLQDILRNPGGALLAWLLSIVFFPTGWIWVFSAFNDPASQVGLNMPASVLGFFLGLALALMAIPVYFGIYLVATLVALLRRRWIFVALYVLFVLLLLVNIQGCTFVGEWAGGF